MSETPNNGTDTAVAPSQGQEQINPGLDTAISGWGDGERGGGSNPEAPVRPVAPVAPVAPVVPQPGQPQTGVPVIPTAQPTPILDQKSIIDSVVSATLAAQRAAQPTAPRQTLPPMSTQDLYKHYGVILPDKTLMTQIMAADPEQGAAALARLFESNMLATVKMVQDLGQAEMAKVRGEFTPFTKSWDTFQAREAEKAAGERFYKAYPHLVNDAVQVKETLDALQARINRGEIRFTDEAQAFKAVADAVDQTIARMSNRSAPLGGPQSPQPAAPQPQVRRPSTATMQGRGGGGPSAPSSTLEKVVDQW